MQSTLDRIAGWMTTRGWYSPGGDGIPRLRELAEVFLPSPEPGARVRVLLVRDESPEVPVLYQVPVVERDVIADPSTPGLIGAGYGGATLFDGVADAAFAAALLAGIHEAGRLRDPADDRMIVESVLVADGSDAVLRLQPYGRPALEVRLHRRVLDGPHPDAVAAEALADAGTVVPPRLAGVLPVHWDEGGTRHVAHLAVVREITGPTIDGWRRVAEVARSGGDADLTGLGRALGTVHRALARQLGTRAITVDERRTTAGAWRTRLAGAAREVPQIADLAEALEELYRRAEALPEWPPMQAVHGALELALTAQTEDGGWILHDFGGAHPAAVGDRADLAAVDVAGLLRSLHYAAGLTGAREGWGAAQRRDLLAGYTELVGETGVPGALLDAIGADFALVDAVWEARVRPETLAVPLAALQRLAGSSRRVGRAVA